MTEIAWGVAVGPPDFDGPNGAFLKALADACARDSAFTVIGWRKVAKESGTHFYLVVDANDGSVPGRNAVGIQRSERLALGFRPDFPMRLDVRALREDFPDVLHLNPVGPNEPRSLCLYDDSWAAVERAWTGPSHLARILWWLRETAHDRLHAPDQPLEPAFYGEGSRIILPRVLQSQTIEKITSLRLDILSQPNEALVVRGRLDPQAKPLSRQEGADFLIVVTSAVDAMRIRHFPPNLCALHEDFVAMGSDLIRSLRARILESVGEKGLDPLPTGTHKATLLLLIIPRLRDGLPDTTEVRGVLVGADIAMLGRACGALVAAPDGRLFRDLMLSGRDVNEQDDKALVDCSAIGVAPVDVFFEIDAPQARLYSGVDESSARFRGMLVGAGALGGLLADLWACEGWGLWDIVDDDLLLPHNVVRHIGRNATLGLPKAEVVHALAGYEDGIAERAGQVFVQAFRQPLTTGLADRARSSDFLVDASTSLYVARDALDDDTLPRMATVFLTPSGNGSVLMLDGADRRVRVAHLEPQYYRAVLREVWGQEHLVGVGGAFRVGGGCRHLSSVLSNELVHIHGGVLARQLRSMRDQAEARLCIWSHHEETGALAAEGIALSEPRVAQVGSWRVLWDEGIETRVFGLRNQHLPSETGGVLVGYIDQKLRCMFVVDALSAPLDSDADATGFTRGREGVLAAIIECQRRTAGIVDYIGEWHSHPREHSATPSALDVELLEHLAQLRAREGLPTLMVIAGHDELSLSFFDAQETLR